MYRKALTDLKIWQQRAGRKPLVIRGARKVGKTWLVRDFARASITSTSKRYFKDPVISASFKTDTKNLPTQTYLMEQELHLINQGLSQITQGLAVNM